MDYLHHYRSPIGDITMASDGTSLTGLWFDGQKYFADTLAEEHEEREIPVFAQTDRWLSIYFDGKAPDQPPPVLLRGTPFRREVWEILQTIPFGQTMTYGRIADILARRHGLRSMSAQAVGGAVGHNPVSLIVPCHRVVGVDGALTGYAGGLDRKAWLLTLENRKNR